jgi:hypothetical protein
MEFGLCGVNLSLQPQLQTMKRPCWGLFFLILMVSCLDDPDCFQLQNNIIGITFRVMGTGQADSTFLQGVGDPPEDIIAMSVSSTLNYFEDRLELLFRGEKKDNYLSLGYTVKNQYVSEECGSRFILSDLTALEHNFDSVRIVNATPFPAAGGTNVEIYRCPHADSITIDFSQLSVTSNGISVRNRSSKNVSHEFTKVTDSLGTTLFSGRAAILHLPVRLLKEQSTFIFTRDERQDTLTVGYRLTTEQRYLPCGIQTFVDDLRIINHTFDSLSFALNDDGEQQRTLADPHQTNVRIYDCPQNALNLLQVNFESSAGTPQTVVIKGITSDHFTGKLWEETDTTVSTVNLPVDQESDVSTFYIEYEDKTDTLSVSYTRTPATLFSSCEAAMLIQNLSLNKELPTATVISTATSLQYPPVTNVEIITD